MMGNIPAELLYMLTMQQILKRKEAHLDASLNSYDINEFLYTTVAIFLTCRNGVTAMVKQFTKGI